MPEQTEVDPEMTGTGKGFTVIVMVFEGPSQFTPLLSKWGITTMVATTATDPGLLVVKEGILPLPFAPSPMLVVLLDHVYVVVPPELEVVKLMADVVNPLHFTWEAGWSTCAVGFTVMVKLFAGPSQICDPLSKCGVTMMVAITGEEPELTGEKFKISPFPLAGNPIPGALFVQV